MEKEHFKKALLCVQLPGSDAGKPDVAGAAKDALKKSPLGFMQVGDVAAAIPGGANDKDAFTAPKPGEAKGLPKGPTATPPKLPSLPKVGPQQNPPIWSNAVCYRIDRMS